MAAVKTSLILTGGGARAAYQVGVLKAVAEVLPNSRHQNPFPIITGTSAGAINGTVVAAHAQYFRLGVKRLERVWANFTTAQVFKSDFRGLLKSSYGFLKGMWLGPKDQHRALSLLNNAPLGELLKLVVDYDHLKVAIEQRVLYALCVTASGYHSGDSVSFFQGHRELKPWRRHRRAGIRAEIHHEHLLASAAIPMLFPATRIGNEYFGDGSVSFLAPLSPALHLGADRIFTVTVEPVRSRNPHGPLSQTAPTIAEIAGHVLDSVFVDTLASDLERLERVNRTLELIPEKVRNRHGIPLKNIRSLLVAPSEDPALLAGDYIGELPRALRFYLKRIGIGEDSGSSVLSYLLFEKGYTRHLIQLGYNDAMLKRDEIEAFFREAD